MSHRSRPPEGILIGQNPNKPQSGAWRVGRLLGSGACGSVHEIERSPPPPPSSSSPTMLYAVKLAPLPPSMAAGAPKRKGKRKKTAAERNADLISHERTLLQNMHGMRGTAVPEIPMPGTGAKVPPAFGEADGYRFLVMERMERPLDAVLPSLREFYHGGGKKATAASAAKKKKAAAGGTAVPLGPVAVAMLDCLRGLHDKGYIYSDVKPENFMLSYRRNGGGRKKASPSSSSSSAMSAEEAGERVRLIDFGLVESFNDMTTCKHREDAGPGGAVVGTPAYASLNVLAGHTSARRDDLEALGYVLCEYVLALRGDGGGTATADAVLPWSGARDDDEILRIKSREVEGMLGADPLSDGGKGGGGDLANVLGAAGAASVLGEYFGVVRGLKYTGKPDYDRLRDILEGLAVSATPPSASAGRKAAAKTTGKKREKNPSAAVVSSPPKRRNDRRRKNELPREADDESLDGGDEDVIEINSSSSSNSDDEEDEKKEEPPSPAKKRSTRTTARGRRAAVTAADDEEKEESPSPAQKRMARTTMRGRQAAVTSTAKTTATTKRTREIATQTSIVDDDDDDDDDVNIMDWEPATATAADEIEAPPDVEDPEEGRGGCAMLTLELVSGPDEGQQQRFVSLGRGGDGESCFETVVLGRTPSAGRGNSKTATGYFAVPGDETASGTHAKLVLHAVVKKKQSAFSVRVTDLSSSNGTFVNGSRIPMGKSKQAFIGNQVQIGDSLFKIRKG